MYNFEIHPGVGIGKLKLGQYRNEVVDLFGRPEEESEFFDEPEQGLKHVTLVWQYDAPDIRLNFWQEDDFRVSMIMVDDPGLNIWGHFIDTYDEAALTSMIRKAGFKYERDVNDEGRIYLDVKSLGLSFAIEGDVLIFASVAVVLEESSSLLA